MLSGIYPVILKSNSRSGQFEVPKFENQSLLHFQYGVKFIRGCEIEGLLDEEGNVIEEGIKCLHLTYIWQFIFG